MPFIENFDEFKTRQNCLYIVIETGSGVERSLFENGAMWCGGAGSDPPEDEKQVLRLKRFYLQEILNRQTKAFNDERQHCLNMESVYKRYPNNPKGIDAETIAYFQRWREKLQSYQSQIAAITTLLADPAELARQEDEEKRSIKSRIESTQLMRDLATL